MTARLMNNTRLTTIIITLVAIISLNGCSSTPYRESAGEFFDSSLITAKVKAKLVDDKITGGFRIKVSTYKGVVYLSGYVNSNLEKKQATNIASGVNGVESIENGLVVRTTN